MEVARLSAISEELEDPVNKSLGPNCGKTAFLQANGTPENKVCILLMMTVAKIFCCIVYNRTTKTIQVVK